MPFDPIIRIQMTPSIPLKYLIEPIRKLLKNHITKQLIFGDKYLNDYQSKEFFQTIINRYKESIDDVNRKLGFTLTFTIFAIYVYFILPETESVMVPLTELSVSRQIWISIAPTISLVLEIMVITSLLWFSALRSGIQTLVENSRLTNSKIEDKKIASKNDSKEAFVNPTNILLKGILGDFWMILGLRRAFKSWLNYIWYIPLMVLAFSILLSPTIIAVFFTYQLYTTNNAILGTIYAIAFFPVSILLLTLIAMAGILGSAEET